MYNTLIITVTVKTMASIKIHILRCGRVRVDRSLPFKEKTLHPFPFTGLFRNPAHQLWLPVFTYLVEHPRGLVLADTGWHTDVRTDQLSHLGRLHYTINKADLPEGEAIHEQLALRGIKTRDLDYVMLSHLHSDHASGLKLVSDAKKILVSEPELAGATGRERIRYIPSMWEGVNLDTYRFGRSEYGPQKSSFDLFGDGSMQFVHTPGHTAGMASAVIQAGGRFVLLFFDTGYARKSWEHMIPPGTAVNRKQAMVSLAWIKTMSLKTNCVESLASHDSDVKPHTIEI